MFRPDVAFRRYATYCSSSVFVIFAAGFCPSFYVIGVVYMCMFLGPLFWSWTESADADFAAKPIRKLFAYWEPGREPDMVCKMHNACVVVEGCVRRSHLPHCQYLPEETMPNARHHQPRSVLYRRQRGWEEGLLLEMLGLTIIIWSDIIPALHPHSFIVMMTKRIKYNMKIEMSVLHQNRFIVTGCKYGNRGNRLIEHLYSPQVVAKKIKIQATI